MADTFDGTTLILVRHGETGWNRIKRIQGQIDIALSPLGERQAALLGARTAAERAAREGTLGRIDAVVSSDLARAMQTAAPIARAAGVAVQADHGLRERHYGVFQGHDAATIRARAPDAYAHWIAHDPDFTPEGGESLRTLYGRVVRTLGAIARRHPGRTVVCVTHGGVLDCAYRFAAALPLTGPRACPVLNASVNRIVWHNGAPDAPVQAGADRAAVLAWADIAHLAGLVDTRDDV
ncbi:histidine phosphatase family protein [Robbsia sp. Bb-Pol-6]|uniref:Histidine phosphatase family protein n=1 Tax=Robbsia betulipollinis TaxID=2981849 RepID=A0ABT3ZLD6_9BURK|nr:histidine phosphatase family protein [Robbsia betulipollinis]MCY0387355.1 histidine phosphatase family protein [Robbsia betulipollinis]